MPPGFWTIDYWTPKGIGDTLEVVGILIVVFGFWRAVRAASRARSAAEQAKKAAEQARASITMFQSIVNFAEGIATLEQIRLLQRMPDAHHLLLDRYQATRKLLIVIRNSNIDLDDGQKTVIQNAIANLVEVENILEKSVATKTPFKSVKHNAILSGDIDGLLAVLTQLKVQTNGVLN